LTTWVAQVLVRLAGDSFRGSPRSAVAPNPRACRVPGARTASPCPPLDAPARPAPGSAPPRLSKRQSTRPLAAVKHPRLRAGPRRLAGPSRGARGAGAARTGRSRARRVGMRL